MVPRTMVFPYPQKKERSDFILLYLKTDDKMYSFLDIEYRKYPDDDFYQKLRNNIRRMCSQVPWFGAEWPDCNEKPELKEKEDVRKYKCPGCENNLVYIPAYDRWYCYGCMEYADDE